MGIGVIETIIRVHHLGREMHPSLTLNSFKHQVILLLRTVLFLTEVRKWYDIADNPLLIKAIQRFPLMSGAMYWPYINHSWRMDRSLGVINQHFRMLNDSAAIIAHATFDEIEVARLDAAYTGLRLVLDKAMWFLREGEVVFNLFVGEQRVYSIAFTLGIDSNQPIVFVGALQGSNADNAQDMYRDITHALHGMRPRDFLMVALKLLCGEFGINRIWAISSEKRQHNSPYFGSSHKEKVLVAYNEVWLEHGGIALDNGFYEIPNLVKRKDMSEIPSRKRSAYRRRYEMLDLLAIDIKLACIKYKPLAV